MKVKQSEMPEITLKYHCTGELKTSVKSSVEAYSLLRGLYDVDTLELIETSIVIFLNRGNRTIGWMKLSVGGTCKTIIDTKLLFVAALKCNASSFIISHNHPSGELTPSEEDIRLTKNIKEGGKLIGIQMLDHLIITKQNYYSFADQKQ